MQTFGPIATLAGFCAAPSWACSLSLVLALDVSASIEPEEYLLQQEGLAAALSHPSVVQAIEAEGGIWVNAYEWSGARHQYPQVAWTFLDDAESIKAVADNLRTVRRRADDFPTSLGYSLGHAMIQLRAAPERCDRQVIDVSSDGENNDGFPPASAYAANDMTGVTVNALVIAEDDMSLVRYYEQEVILGSGAFVEVAQGYTDYERAMRRKLLREIGVRAFAMMD